MGNTQSAQHDLTERLMRLFNRLSTASIRSAMVAIAVLAACGSAEANFLDDNSAFSFAISVLRSALGDHPRVLKIEVEADAIEIEAQDPRNHDHVDRWRYGTVRYLRFIPVKRLTGPQPVDLQLVNPDLEANLFDLDAVDLTAAPRLISSAITRAELRDAAVATRMEIVRQTFILPKPTSGDVRWTVRVDSGREHAEIYSDSRGAIIGADLSATQRAKTLDLLSEPSLAADAAAAFRSRIGAGAVLTSVAIDRRTVSFGTNIRDQTITKIAPGMPATASFTWDLNGLQQRLGTIDANAPMGAPGPAAFSVDDVNWTIIAALERDALSKVALPQASVMRIGVSKSSEQPGGPTLVWTIEIADRSDEQTLVIANMEGIIRRVVLPPSRRRKTDWLDAGTIASAIARVASTFGPGVKIASLVFDGRRGRITLDDPANGGRPATFDFTKDSVERAAISFSLDAMGPRLERQISCR